MTYFFVGGSQRSGTSLLLRILCDDPETNPNFGECAYLRSLFKAYESGKKTFDELTYLFDSPEDFRRFHTGLVQNFLQHCLERFAPAKHLVLKEPHMTMVFPEVHELLPTEAKFLVMMRDPRDVVASMLDVGQKMSEKGTPHFFNKAEIPDLVAHFKNFYVACFNACSKDEILRKKVLVLRYESLVSQPDTELAKLRAFTGLALPEAGKHAPGKRTVKTGSSARQQPWRTELSGQAISASKVSNYRSKLSAEQIRQIEDLCQDIFRIFKYQPDESLDPAL